MEKEYLLVKQIIEELFFSFKNLKDKCEYIFKTTKGKCDIYSIICEKFSYLYNTDILKTKYQILKSLGRQKVNAAFEQMMESKCQ